MIPCLEREHTREAEAAALETWGRPLRFGDYRISGVYSDEFNAERKAKLRDLARRITRARDVRAMHLAAKRRASK